MRPEDHGRLGRLGIEDARQGVDAAGAGDFVRRLADLRHGHLFAGDGDALRVVHVARGKGYDARRHGGGEEGHLPFGRGLLQDPLDVLDEAHVEHFVRFVEDEEADVIELEGAAAHVVHDATRRADHDLRATLQAAELPLVWLPAVDRQRLDVLVAAVLVERFRDLNGELARGRQDQRLHGSLPGIDGSR